MKAGRKILAGLLILVMVAGLLPPTALAAESGTLGDYVTWTLDGSTLTISGNGDMINGSVIDNFSTWELKYNVTTVIIEPGVTSIGDNAFDDLVNLSSITIPDTVTRIGTYVLYDTAVTQLTIPNSVTSVEDSAFIGMSSLERVSVPSSLPVLPKFMFSSCESLRSVELAEGITTISWGAFSGCTSLESINLPSTLTTIEGGAFQGCASLPWLEIPSGVTTLTSSVFSGCSSFVTVDIPSHITTIETGAFQNCTGLKSVTIPSSVTSLGHGGAFSGCTSLESVTLPNSITEIPNEMFKDCTSLRSIEIPEGVTTLRAYSFAGCTSLESVQLPSTLTGFHSGVFENCISLRSFELPSTATGISASLFNGCSALESITIPAGVIRVSENAFAGCTSIREIIYGGSESDWSNIYFVEGNEPITDAVAAGALVATGTSTDTGSTGGSTDTGSTGGSTGGSTDTGSTEEFNPGDDIELSPGSGAIPVAVEDTISLEQHMVMGLDGTTEKGFSYTLQKDQVAVLILYRDWSDASRAVVSSIADSILVEDKWIKLIAIDVDMTNEAGLRNFTEQYVGDAADKFTMYRLTQSRDLYNEYGYAVGMEDPLFPLVMIIDSEYYIKYYLTGVNSADVYVDAAYDVLASDHGIEKTGPEYGIATNNGVNLKSGALDMPKLTEDEIRQLLTDNPVTYPADIYEVEPSTTAPYKAGVVKTEYLQEAVDRLTALRRIAGLPGVTLLEEKNEQQQHGAVLLSRSLFDHFPPKPDDMDDEFHEIATASTSSSNIARGASLTSSVDCFMQDNGANNAERVGHRRWQLNPKMGATSFGIALDDSLGSDNVGYVTEWAFDKSVTDPVDYDFISWPPSGSFPNESTLFKASTPWSISLNPEKYETPLYSELVIRLTRVEDGATWVFDGDDDLEVYEDEYSPLCADSYIYQTKYHTINNQGFGTGACIIFRPDGLDLFAPYDGTYRVELDGLRDAYGNPVEFGYEVNFFTMSPDTSNKLKSSMFRVDTSKAFFTGEPITKKVVSSTLVEGVDYTVSYLDNVNPGRAWILIDGLGRYEGTSTHYCFQIFGNPNDVVEEETLDGLGWVDTTGDLDGIPALADELTDDYNGDDDETPDDTPQVTFTDVADPAVWYYDAVYAAAGAGIIAGNEDGTFAPDKHLSWAETVTFAVRIAQLNAGEQIYGAADQTGTNWYDVYVDYALVHGFITEASASPDAAITRGMAAQIFAAALGDAEQVNAVAGDYFTDVPQDGDAYDAVYKLARAGIVNGKLDTTTGVITFGTDDTFLRSEVATIVARMAGLVEKATIS